MQNKSAVLLFTILLALAALYTLSFNFVSSNFEDKAEAFAKGYADSLITADGLSDDDFDNLVKNAKKDYLRDHANDTIYPVFGHTYQDVKENELNLGLDLKGGMSVTLEVYIPELINNLSGKNSYEPFQ
ncbi:MAG: protein translocase subunit SecDF, partial [Bacteroidota bacterium]